MGQGAGKQVNAAPVEIAEKPLETKPQETFRGVQVPQGIATSRLRMQRNDNNISPEQRRKLNSSKIYDKMTGSQWDERKGTFVKSSLIDFKKGCLDTKKQVDETIQKLINLHILPPTTKPAIFHTPKKHIFNSITNKESIKQEPVSTSNTSRQQEYYSNRKSVETNRLDGSTIFSHSPVNPRRNNYVSLDPIRSSQPLQINSVRKVYQPPKSVKELMKPTKISHTVRYVKAPLQPQRGSALQVRLILEDHQYKLQQLQSQYGHQQQQQPLLNSFVEDIGSHKKEESHNNEPSEMSILQSNKPNFSSEMLLKPMEMHNRSPLTTAATVNNKSCRDSVQIHQRHNDSQDIKPYPPSILETIDNPEGDDNAIIKEPLKKKKLSVKERLLALEQLPPIRVDLSKFPLSMNRIKAKETSSRKAISEGASNNGRVRKIRINSVDTQPPPANRRLDIIKIQYLEKYLGHKS